MLPRALIFDVDGTLADTERDGHRVAFNRAFAEAGLDWEWDIPLYGELLRVTGGKERMKHYANRLAPSAVRHDLDTLIPRMHVAKNQYYNDLLAAAKIPLRPGVRKLLEQARAAGVRLAIATTTSPENVLALLSHALPDGEQWFDVIGAGDVVAAKKPAPDIYFWVLERLGLAARDCLAFEDSENGLRSALAAGLTTIVTPNGYTKDHDFTGAAAIAADLSAYDMGALARILKA
jgi:HAD superfamily hydrolase (TIGR01509 family)